MHDDTIRVGSTVDLIVHFHVDEIQQLSSTATSGALRLRLGATWTTDIPYDATNQDIAAALQALPEISRDGVICWGGPLNVAPMSVRFSGRAGKRSQPELIVDATDLADGTVTVTTTQPGGPVALDTEPTITVRAADGTESTLTPTPLDDQGAYTARYTPQVAGVHTWTVDATSSVHGTDQPKGSFTAR